MIEEFKEGHWYKWIGSKERPGFFNVSGSQVGLIGLMDFLLEDKWYLCKEVPSNKDERYKATFETGNPKEEREWSFYGYLDKFIESKNPIDENNNLVFNF